MFPFAVLPRCLQMQPARMTSTEFFASHVFRQAPARPSSSAASRRVSTISSVRYQHCPSANDPRPTRENRQPPPPMCCAFSNRLNVPCIPCPGPCGIQIRYHHPRRPPPRRFLSAIHRIAIITSGASAESTPACASVNVPSIRSPCEDHSRVRPVLQKIHQTAEPLSRPDHSRKTAPNHRCPPPRMSFFSGGDVNSRFALNPAARSRFRHVHPPPAPSKIRGPTLPSRPFRSRPRPCPPSAFNTRARFASAFFIAASDAARTRPRLMLRNESSSFSQINVNSGTPFSHNGPIAAFVVQSFRVMFVVARLRGFCQSPPRSLFNSSAGSISPDKQRHIRCSALSHIARSCGSANPPSRLR